MGPDRDAALFLDCDMAILGAPADGFDEYDAAIAREYSIFLSEHVHGRLDAAARANVARALGRCRDDA